MDERRANMERLSEERLESSPEVDRALYKHTIIIIIIIMLLYFQTVLSLYIRIHSYFMFKQGRFCCPFLLDLFRDVGLISPKHNK